MSPRCHSRMSLAGIQESYVNFAIERVPAVIPACPPHCHSRLFLAGIQEGYANFAIERVPPR